MIQSAPSYDLKETYDYTLGTEWQGGRSKVYEYFDAVCIEI